MSIDLTKGLKNNKEPKNYITYGEFDSRRFNLYLSERNAPTPDERVFIDTIPHRHGVIDCSNILGERIYENREIEYSFYCFNVTVEKLEKIKTTIENLIMKEYDQILNDSHDLDYYYIGKCSGVVVEDDYAYNRLLINITFDLYPFKISKLPEGHDMWDKINFDLDVFEKNVWNIKDMETDKDGKKIFNVINTGRRSICPEFKVSSYTVIEINGRELILRSNETKNNGLILKTGINNIRIISGSGRIELKWYKEMI